MILKCQELPETCRKWSSKCFGLDELVTPVCNTLRGPHVCLPTSVCSRSRYAENTASVLLYLTLEAAGIRTTVADHAASHIG